MLHSISVYKRCLIKHNQACAQCQCNILQIAEGHWDTGQELTACRRSWRSPLCLFLLPFGRPRCFLLAGSSMSPARTGTGSCSDRDRPALRQHLHTQCYYTTRHAKRRNDALLDCFQVTQLVRDSFFATCPVVPIACAYALQVCLKVEAQLRGVKPPVRVLHTVFSRPVSAARRPAPPFLSRRNAGLQALLIFHPLLLSALLQQSHGGLLLTSCQALLCQALHGQGALVLAAWRPSPPAWYLLMGPCITATVFNNTPP